jgi:EH_Signature domain
MMSSLSRLRSALQDANSNRLNGLEYDPRPLDKETANLRSWLGGRGSDKPPQDAILEALRAFRQEARLDNRRQARLVCFGCIEPFGAQRFRLIEDRERFPKLLSGVDAYAAEPRSFRLCYRGLLNGYFGYDPDAEDAALSGKTNWGHLRDYLKARILHTVAPGVLPAWVESLQTNTGLLTDDPGKSYGEALLGGHSVEFEKAKEALDIRENSWLIWRLVLGQVEAATAKSDSAFLSHLPDVLELLEKHSLALNVGLVKLLERYRACTPLVIHPRLRDFAVAHWGNPWLSLNRATWSLVSDEARGMVADWLKLVLIQQFFSLLAADGTNDTRRLKFWERYHKNIDDMYFALGNTARRHRGLDFQEIRRKMAGRVLGLHSAGPPDNNAFVMCIGDHVVVEFGLKGNACFIFRRDTLPFQLKGELAGNSTELKHERRIERLLHHDASHESWERKFQTILASLMRIQPSQPNDAIKPFVGAASATNIRNTANRTNAGALSSQGQLPPNMRGGANAPVQRDTQNVFSEREFARLCAVRRLRTEDLRSKNGNLWVFSGESDRDLSAQLRSWGFTFKAGKGWWRK